MQNTDIITKEADLNIVYGPFYKGEKVHELNFASVKYMYTDLTDIRKYYIRLGFHLYEFYCRVGYMSFGYATLYDFCEANLGLDKGAVSRCMNVYREFNAKNDVEHIGNFESHGSAMELSKRWQDYSYTQLCEMLSLSEDQRKEIRSDMTIKQIREYKRKLRDEEHKTKELDKNLNVLNKLIQKSKESVASTQLEDSDPAPDPVASTQLFDFDEYENRKGIVRYNYVKKCDPIEGGRNKLLYVFDERGKEVIFDDQCDILINDDGDIVIRLYYNAKPLEWDENQD